MEIDVFELFIDEENEFSGVNAMSVVEHPAIESDFVALSKEKVQLAEISGEKRILMGAALIPDKKIYRRNGEYEYYIYFSKDTVRKASELFFIKGNQSNSTLEHEVMLNDMTVVESWIVEDPKMDKSAKYGIEVPEGSWMISMKVNNDTVWNEYVKTGYVKGFSLEGFFSDNMPNRPTESLSEELSDEQKLSIIVDDLLNFYLDTNETSNQQ